MGLVEKEESCCTIEILKKDECCGCTSCFNICPNNAIKMEYDGEGFKYPIIDKSKCIECRLCQQACPIINETSSISLEKCYAAFNKNTNARLKSSSGGIFDILAKFILSEGGLVVGAAYNNENNLNHIIIDDIKDLEYIRGSKYLQSNLNDIFDTIKNALQYKKVLFVGTPCQVGGLKTFLNGKEDDNLYCCDLICHGVPSKKVFEKYLSELEVQGGKIHGGINFRNKKDGWETYHISANQENYNYYMGHSKDLYMKLFLSDICLRPSCYNCDFKLGNKYSDITLGDYWGISEQFPELNDQKGISAVIVNTIKGNFLFECIKNDIIFKECNIEQILLLNPSLKKSAYIKNNRNDFFKDLDLGYSMQELVDKYTFERISLFRKILRKLKSVLKMCK